MIDDSMSNVLNKYLEGLLVMQDRELKGLKEERDKAYVELAAYKENVRLLNDIIDRLEEDLNESELEVLGLKDQRELNHKRLDKKDNIIVGLQDDLCGAERFIKRLEDECLAIAIQAAESEDRAEQERRGRLQLVMRM
jgi:hypothetical protein